MANKKPKQLKDKDYTELGKAVEQIIQKDYFDLVANRKKLLWTNFLKGLASGVGGVIGATLVIALLVWLLHFLDHIPLVGELIRNTRDTIKH